MENPIAPVIQTYKDVTFNPSVSAGLQGTAAFGVGVVGWDRIIETLRSMLRRPVSFAMKMSPKEFDKEMEDIKNDKKLKWILPGALGLVTAGGSLAASYRPNEEYGGLLSWNAKAKPLDTDMYRGYVMPGSQNLSKNAAMHKLANAAFEYGGYVPKIDFSQVLDAPNLKQNLFSNDPWMQNDPYTRNTGIAILSDAQNRSGSSNVTLGTIHDSASDKFKSKFSLMGIADIGLKTVCANLAADLLVSAIGTMTGVPKGVQEDLISTATWYQAAKSILT